MEKNGLVLFVSMTQKFFRYTFRNVFLKVYMYRKKGISSPIIKCHDILVVFSNFFSKVLLSIVQTPNLKRLKPKHIFSLNQGSKSFVRIFLKK